MRDWNTLGIIMEDSISKMFTEQDYSRKFRSCPISWRMSLTVLGEFERSSKSLQVLGERAVLFTVEHSVHGHSRCLLGSHTWTFCGYLIWILPIFLLFHFPIMFIHQWHPSQLIASLYSLALNFSIFLHFPLLSVYVPSSS